MSPIECHTVGSASQHVLGKIWGLLVQAGIWRSKFLPQLRWPLATGLGKTIPPLCIQIWTENYACKPLIMARSCRGCLLAPDLSPSAEGEKFSFQSIGETAQHLWSSAQANSKQIHLLTFTSPALPFLLQTRAEGEPLVTQACSCEKSTIWGRSLGHCCPPFSCQLHLDSGECCSKQQSLPQLCAALFNSCGMSSIWGRSLALSHLR